MHVCLTTQQRISYPSTPTTKRVSPTHLHTNAVAHKALSFISPLSTFRTTAQSIPTPISNNSSRLRASPHCTVWLKIHPFAPSSTSIASHLHKAQPALLLRSEPRAHICRITNTRQPLTALSPHVCAAPIRMQLNQYVPITPHHQPHLVTIPLTCCHPHSAYERLVCDKYAVLSTTATSTAVTLPPFPTPRVASPSQTTNAQLTKESLSSMHLHTQSLHVVFAHSQLTYRVRHCHTHTPDSPSTLLQLHYNLQSAAPSAATPPTLFPSILPADTY